ncbi:TOM1-like protein 3 [Impatiens glandulifera]|uniref:TOM1-like protein 3 n=1 Tax=Impatiens glandulifera TaxID=253017 RepID=UPI001FB100EB|nr:TOM1-like protein 3 [Impatiens glandulifera]
MAGVSCADRATSDMLIGPDWAVNIELCDIINRDPGQAKDALKLLKKRLGDKNPKIQLLTLSVLETISKNCGEHIFQQIAEGAILEEMVNIVKKKPDLSVREKILILIDTWQVALGGPRGNYPQYHAAYHELKAAGVDFPPREENSVPIFTPRPVNYPTSAYPTTSTIYEEAALQASLQSDASGLSPIEIQNAQGLADMLMEILEALDPRNHEDLKQEVIVDLVGQCQSYQKQAMALVSNTVDEALLVKGLALNDNLQSVLQRYNEMLAKKISNVNVKAREFPVVRLTSVNNEDDELEDDFSQLARRSSRENVLGKKSSIARNEPVRIAPLLPPPPSAKKSISNNQMFDYLSGDTYNSHDTSSSTPPPNDNFINPTASMFTYDKELVPTSTPSHQQHFLEPQHSKTGSDSSFDSLVGKTQELSLNPPPASTKQETQEALLFNDLVDFGKGKSTSSSTFTRR